MPYEEFTNMTFEMAKNFLVELADERIKTVMADIVGNHTVLDVGCGNGMDARRYNSDQYLGLDISENNVKVAKLRNPDHHFINMEAKEYLPLSPHVDYIICKSVLEHQTDLEDALKLFNLMLEKCDVLLIGWHMIPGDKTEIITTKGHFGRDIKQNWYNKKAFEIGVNIKKKRIDNYELWIITKI